MEEQIIKTIGSTKPRVTLKKLTDGFNWDIGISESGNLEEIKLMIKDLEEANNIMKERFPTKPKAPKIIKAKVKKKKGDTQNKRGEIDKKE